MGEEKKSQKQKNESLKILAKSIKSNVFAIRPSVSEAYIFASRLINSLSAGDRIVAYTALQVMLNTVSEHIERNV